MRFPGLLVLALLFVPAAAQAQSGVPPVASGPVRATIGVPAQLIPRQDTGSAADSSRAVPPFLMQPRQLGQDTSELTVDLMSTLQSRLERNRNDRCEGNQSGLSLSACRAAFQPLFDFDFNILSRGTIARRVRVDVDYDSRREFDASNNISISYAAPEGEFLRRVEIGNLSFVPPYSRFITSGIPRGNYGIQAEGELGPLTLQAIAARQKGRVVRSESFSIGGDVLRTVSAQLDDYAFEPRRFFFTVDPSLLGEYPNIDILNTPAMLAHAASLPDTLRPTRLAVYRVLIGGQPPNPNGPRFIARGAQSQTRGLVYEPLREGVDYYADPSLLWISLVRQLRRDERLVVAYNVLLADGSTVYSNTGGTPDLVYTDAPQFANLLWDADVQPTDSVFNREIRSAYRLAGADLVRSSVSATIVTGPGEGQERPAGGNAGSYLALFGLSETFNASRFDTENRIWPREFDPIYNRATGGSGSEIIPDHFVILPSLRPFARDGLATAGNPANNAIYEQPAEDFRSSRRPPSVYRLLVNFATLNDGESGSISLGNIQVRPGSERLVMDGYLLARDIDYEVDYELGRVRFNRPDTLFVRERSISIQYEENPFFAISPTSILAFGAQLPFSNGSLGLIAVNQSQGSAFSRPTLGFEPAASFLAGVNATYKWDLPWLSNRGASGNSTPTALRLSGELAMSRPNPNSRNTAYMESFQGQGGSSAPVNEPQWYFSSRPSPSASIAEIPGVDRASTLVWQNYALTASGNVNTFRSGEIDPNISVAGRFSTPEPLLWLTLFPLSVGGTRNTQGEHDWTISAAPPGRRWRSLRASLGASGTDLTRTEHLEFWALVDTTSAGRAANPTLVVDLGDISEQTISFGPDTALVSSTSAGAAVLNGFRGKQLLALDRLDSERDSFSLAFDASVNDTGIPGDVVGQLTLKDAGTGIPLRDSADVRICTADRRILTLGDSRANCTVGNARLDEEDLDGDRVLNFAPDAERLLRFVVDMSAPASWNRVGGCTAPGDPRLPASAAGAAGRCWVNVRLPIADAELVGNPLLRRMKTVRITMISGAGAADEAFTFLPLTRLLFSGAPWVKRSENAIAGIAGAQPSGGLVSASVIGTLDSSSTLPYQPPPGVREAAEEIAGEFATAQVQINERSLRLTATGLALHERAEAYYRFPDGQKNFMSYSQLRLWARGRNSGWGDDGELNFFLRLGRDENNFYLYRTAANSGPFQNAWEPEVRVDFARFFALRASVQSALLAGTPPASSCSATDSALVAASGLPAEGGARRVFACDGAYMIYTTDATVSPPSLGAVEEMAVGMVRVSQGTGANPIVASDTLELWVDEIRLTGVVSSTGYAGFVGAELTGSDLASLSVNLSRRDRNFRQLAEQPSFVTRDEMEVASTVRLDRIARTPIGWEVPLTVSHTTYSGDPFFVSGSDIPAAGLTGLRTPRDARSSYALSARRVAPSDGSLFQNLLQGLTVRGAYATSGARGEYSSGDGTTWRLGAEYDLTRRASSDAAAEPGLFPEGGLLPGATIPAPSATSRWTPTVFRVSSDMIRSTDNRSVFLDPARTTLDGVIPGRVAGESRLWRSGAVVQFRPLESLSLGWELSSSRDLRDYGDSTRAGRLADEARGSFLGADAGMERERNLRSTLAFAPVLTSWLAPRLQFDARYGLSRDPNAGLSPGETGDAEQLAQLPSRLYNSQNVAAGLTFTPGALLRALGADSATGAAISRVMLPIDISFSRSLLSVFNRADFTPSLLYQLSLGGIQSFREQDGRSATSAGETNSISLASTLRPMRGVALVNRASVSVLQSFTSLQMPEAYRMTARARTFPDLSLRLDNQLAGAAITAVSGQAGVRHTVRDLRIPSFAGAVPDMSRDATTTFPANLSITWSAFGGFSTSGDFTFTSRDEGRTGIEIGGWTRTMGAEIGKRIPAGTIAGIDEAIRTRVHFRSTQTRSTISSAGSMLQRRLVDNGRYTIGFSADSDVSETMVLSVGASQAVTYDRNFNRRFTQTILSVVLQIDMGGLTFR